jgi:cell fate regulator YaaT (PSP1 superfamily)
VWESPPDNGPQARCSPDLDHPHELDRLIQVGFKGHRIELCILPEGLDLEVGAVVVVDADRGFDVGTVLRCGRGILIPNRKRPTRQILRRASPEEISRIDPLRKQEIDALQTCRKRVESFGLPMHTVDAEFQFDGNRVTFYFTAEGRVDFRALVRDLAKIFRTRIELRQIHPREAARRQGGAGPCGREICCARFLQTFEPVTLKMAKRQKLALAPQRISGICGRLLCCLIFDEEAAGGDS